MSNPKQKTCFIIRPFNDLHNRRHEDIFTPAIEAAGLSVRPVGDPVSGTNKEIEDGIRNAHVCFADVSENNAGVWDAVKFAFTCGKKVVLVCNADMREINTLPFGVEVKKVIPYKKSVDSKIQDVVELQKKITAHIKKLLGTNQPFASQPQIGGNTSIIHDGLTQEDLNILLEIMEYYSAKGYPMTPLELKKNHLKPLDVDKSIKKLMDKEYITLIHFRALRKKRDSGYKSTEKAQKLYESNRELFYK